MKKQTLLILLSLAIVTLIMAGCNSTSTLPATNHSLTLTDYEFTPSTLTVPAGEEITLKLVNESTVNHQWVLMFKPVELPFDDDDKDNVLFAAEVESGKSITVTFTAPLAAGEYQFVCTNPGHLEAGMAGKLVVVQP